MTEDYRVESLSKLFDDTKKVLSSVNPNLNNMEMRKINVNDKEHMRKVNTLNLSKVIVKIIKDVLMDIQMTKKSVGIINATEFNKNYNIGELKIEKESLTTDDIVFNKDNPFVYETPSIFKITNDELKIILNFSSTTWYSDKDLYHEGGSFEVDGIDMNLLKELLQDNSITVDLHKEIGVDSNGWKTMSTVLLEIHYYRNFLPKIKIR